jgi:hypothetical protein
LEERFRLKVQSDAITKDQRWKTRTRTHSSNAPPCGLFAATAHAGTTYPEAFGNQASEQQFKGGKSSVTNAHHVIGTVENAGKVHMKKDHRHRSILYYDSKNITSSDGRTIRLPKRLRVTCLKDIT